MFEKPFAFKIDQWDYVWFHQPLKVLHRLVEKEMGRQAESESIVEQ